MTTDKKQTKNATKSKAKTVDKTSTKAKHPRLDLDTFSVSQTELAYIIGLQSANITSLIQNGSLKKDTDGRLNLRDAVSGYVKRLRERKEGARSKSDIDTETAVWKLQNLKIKNRDWRIQRDRFIAMEILSSLGSAMVELREAVKGDAQTVRAVDKMIKAIDAISPDDIALKVEGEDDEEED